MAETGMLGQADLSYDLGWPRPHLSSAQSASLLCHRELLRAALLFREKEALEKMKLDGEDLGGRSREASSSQDGGGFFTALQCWAWV